MCKNRRSLMAATPHTRTPRPAVPSSSSSSASVSGIAGGSTTSFPAEYYQNTTTSSALTSTSSSSAALSRSRDSLASLRHSLPDSPSLYSFSELSAATNHFLSKRLSSSSSAWRCSLRGKDAVLVQLPLRADPSALPSRLSSLSRSHDAALVPLLGACVAADHLYLVYPFVPGASLRDCLRNPRNPSFTPLSTWISRIQVAADLAHGLDYIHHHSRTVHNRIKSSSILVTEPHFNAKICHFGAADLSGEVPEEIDSEGKDKNNNNSEIDEISSSSFDSPKIRRSTSRGLRIEGTRGYMAPEVISGGRISKRSDVYAFGVVILELISGMEPIKYRFDRATKEYHRLSVIEAAREAIGGTEDEEGGDEAEERRGRVRRWVDGRLRDSFPVEVAERLVRVALRCVEEEPWMRPEMTWVAGKVSKMLLESAAWQERVRVPTDFTVSLAPR